MSRIAYQNYSDTLVVFVLCFRETFRWDEKDYRAVFRALIDILSVPPAVSQITADLERAIWSVLRQVLTNVKIQDYAFHWSQGLWRKVCNNVVGELDKLDTIKTRSLETGETY